MEDNLYFSKNGRQPQFFQKWKTTSIFWDREDNKFPWKMEDDPNISRTLLNSKSNPSILGLCTAQVMGFFNLN